MTKKIRLYQPFGNPGCQRPEIRKLMNKRKYDPKGATWEEKGKMQAFLYRKGYSQSSVRAAMGAESLDSDGFSV